MERLDDRLRQPIRRPLSNRFIAPSLRMPMPRQHWSGQEVFAEGQWQTLRVQLEARGWTTSQIELIHGHLRQGWPLAMAENHVAVLYGCCPLRSRQPHP